MAAPIVSRKHYVHLTNSELASGGITSFNAVDAVVAPATASSEDVIEGSVVKAVHFEIWCGGRGAANADTQFFMAIEKLPTSAPAMTLAQSSNLGAYPNKKNVLYTTQGVLGDGTTQSVPIIRDWLLIPKGKQRMGLGDRIAVTITTLGQAMNRCGIITYKEYQ